MANYNATGKKPKGAVELVQRTRAAIINTFDVIDNRGKKISEILADEFENNPIKFMELASKYIPRELSGNVKHDHEHKHTHESVSDTAEWISGLLESGKNSPIKKPRAN